MPMPPKFSSPTSFPPPPSTSSRPAASTPTCKTGLSKDELIKIIGDYDGLAIRSATKADKDVLAAAKRLKVIGRAGIGVDNVDIPAATAAGVVVMNTPFGNSITTAEHAIAHDVRAGPPAARRRRLHPGRQVGEEPLHGRRALRQDAGPDRRRQHRLDRRRPRQRPEDARGRLRPLPVAGAGGGARRREGRARRPPGARRHHHPAHAAHRQDPQHPLGRGAGQGQEGRADHQLRPRRPGGRGRRCARRSTAAMSAARRSTSSSRSRPRRTRCSARRTSSPRRIWAPPPTRRRRTSRCRWPSR